MILNSKNLCFFHSLFTDYHFFIFIVHLTNHSTAIVRNVKDIAKLRGSEDLWEVAKLHNRESSFPVVYVFHMPFVQLNKIRRCHVPTRFVLMQGLYHAQWLPSIKLQDWCETNTKRPEFLGDIPNSLFDLLEKCLTVNPRVRISAEEALKHEFFTPCHEGMRSERLN